MRRWLCSGLGRHHDLKCSLLGKLDGLTEEQAGQRTVGSCITLHGLVRHMTTMEQFFFVECVGGLVEPYP